MMLLKGRTLIVLALLVVFFSLATPNFLSANTMLLLAKHVALYGILAIGMTYVIITGGINLSVGAVVGLAGIIAGGMIQNGVTIESMGVTLYFSIPLVVLITIICGAAVGLINGAIILALIAVVAAILLKRTVFGWHIFAIGGTIIGAFVIGVISDGMVMCGVSEFWQMVIKGLVIILAVIIDQFQRNMEAKMALQARNESK